MSSEQTYEERIAEIDRRETARNKEAFEQYFKEHPELKDSKDWFSFCLGKLAMRGPTYSSVLVHGFPYVDQPCRFFGPPSSSMPLL